MKVYNILKTAAVLLAASVMTTGCIKETFPYEAVTTLDQVSPQNQLNAIPNILITNYIGTGAHIDFGYGGLLGAYDRMCGEVFPVGSQYYDQWGEFLYPTMSAGLSPNGSGAYFLWMSYYQYIKTTNDLIGSYPAGTRNEYVGVARTFRALYYLDMARLYDPLPCQAPENAGYVESLKKVEGLTVPIIDESNSETGVVPRATREQIFTFIFNDLNEAEECLKNYTPADKSLPSLAVVYGLKARTYLWLGGFDDEQYDNIPTGYEAYEKAAEYARKAIDKSGCTIMSENEWVNKTTGFNTVNNSWMWAMIQSSSTVLNNLLSWSAHVSVESIYGYGNMTQPGISNASYSRLSDTDFRKRVFVNAKGNWEKYKDITTLTKDEFQTIEAFAGLKFKTANGEKNFPMQGNVTSIPLMRVEEMYLIEAEAKCYSMYAESEQLLKSFMSHRDPKYKMTAGAELLDEIIFQKRIEFWGEGIILFDFKRLDMSMTNGEASSNAPYGARFNTEGRAPWWNPCIYYEEAQQNTALKELNNPDPTATYESKDYI